MLLMTFLLLIQFQGFKVIMPPKKTQRKTKYQKDWESKKEADNTYGFWLSKGRTEHHAHCNLCRKDFAVDGSGFAQVTTHAKGAEHKKIYKDTICM